MYVTFRKEADVELKYFLNNWLQKSRATQVCINGMRNSEKGREQILKCKLIFRFKQLGSAETFNQIEHRVWLERLSSKQTFRLPFSA